MSASLGHPHVSSPDFLIPDLQEFLFTGTLNMQLIHSPLPMSLSIFSF